MSPDQNLSHVTRAALEGLYQAIGDIRPDCVIVQGDTTTTFVGALAASYHQIKVAHVEAGLRTYDRAHPFPEEMNRCLTTQIADFHFAPTELSRENLLREGIAPGKIWVTGNTAIDALLHTLGDMEQGAAATSSPAGTSGKEERTILLTAHRRENHGAPLEQICDAVLRLLEAFPDIRFRFPVHLSPRVRHTVFARLGDSPRITLEDPLDYQAFVTAMSQAYLILTDSGGVQEEAPSLGKPVLVLRETTERPEAIDAGTAKLVGSDADRIFQEASRLLENTDEYERVAKIANPYGDGTAARQILGILENIS
jgi:UDP-N-acetylglucosamine 2-epimerase (non-hydrolysing)